MDLSAQLLTVGLPSSRRGAALAIAIMAIVFLAIIPITLFGIASAEARSRENEAATARAQELAESGLAHALGLLNGPLNQISMFNLMVGPNGTWDGVTTTSDDGLLLDDPTTGWSTLRNTGLGIPRTGIALSPQSPTDRYYVRVIEDPAEDPLAATSAIGGALWGTGSTPRSNPVDDNGRVMVQCLGVTDGGRARAVVSAIVDGRRGNTGIVVGGDLKIASSVRVVGMCGEVHANGSIQSTSNSPASAKKWSTSVSFSGDPTKLTGIREVLPSVPIPDIDPAAMCDLVPRPAGAIYRLVSATNAQDGSWSGNTWTIAPNKLSPSTPQIFCVPGNVIISGGGNNGSASAPLLVTIVATGSVDIQEPVFLAPAAVQPGTEGYTIISGGDLSFTKFTKTGGLLGVAYCRSQLGINADLQVGNEISFKSGQMVCRGDDNTGKTLPADWVKPSGSDNPRTSYLNSRTDLFFQCVSPLKAGVKRTATFLSFGS